MEEVRINGELWVACSGCGAYVPWEMHHPVNLKHNWWEIGYRNLGQCKVEHPVCPPRHEARATWADVPGALDGIARAMADSVRQFAADNPTMSREECVAEFLRAQREDVR